MKFVLYFRTKNEDFPSPFKKARIKRHDQGDLKCFVTIVEEENLKRAWEFVFTCCPDYAEAGHNNNEKVKDPENPNRMIDETVEMIAKRV